MNSDPVTWLQGWYQSQCDGSWEHSCGVKIDTLNNPGWLGSIDLIETELENLGFANIEVECSEKDWINCKVEDQTGRLRFYPRTFLLQTRTFSLQARNFSSQVRTLSF